MKLTILGIKNIKAKSSKTFSTRTYVYALRAMNAIMRLCREKQTLRSETLGGLTIIM